MQGVLVCLVTALFCLTEGFYLNVNVHYPAKNLPNNVQLGLRGNTCGLSWGSSAQLAFEGQDLWTTQLSCPAGINGTIQMKVMAGSTWQIGTNSLFAVPSSGSQFSVDMYPWFYTNTGSWAVVNNGLWSPQLQNSRPVVAYVPPIYFENPYKVMKNVLIMHDGQNLFDPKTSAFGVAWMCQNTVNALINEGQMDDLVIIGLYNTINRTNEYTYSYDPSQKAGGQGNVYLDFIQQTVLPWVSKNFNVDISSKDNLGILGSSLGGLISCYAGWTRSSIWGRAGCMSSSFWWNSEDFNNQILVQDSNPLPQLEVYLDSGDAGPSNDDVLQTIAVRNHMEKLSYVLGTDLFYYLDHGGQHSEIYWGARFHIPMADLYPVPVTMPTPA